MYIRAISRAALLCSTILSFNAFAAADRVDYDLDDDGLIEINDLADLNEIRNHLDGAALYGDSTGCPEGGCNGFELTTDLDFDTNGDGQMNELDTYWSNGEGWEPIGSSSSNAFTGDFHGNGHQVRNLYIDRSGNAGLFGYIQGTADQTAVITELAITGSMTYSTSTNNSSGILATTVSYAEISSVFVSGLVRANLHAGGLAGIAYDTSLHSVFSSTSILSGKYQGGLISSIKDGMISSSLSTGYVDMGGGALGISIRENTHRNLYWAKDVSSQPESAGTNSTYFGAHLNELQCPTSANDSACTDEGILFENWNTEDWEFGTNRQLPGLILGDRIYRDSDGDGALDEEDAYPDTFAVSLDTDTDGYPDRFTLGCDASCRNDSGLTLDAFPLSAEAYLDAELDGLVDEWAEGCDTTCQGNSGLTLDDYPDDRDNDGISDAVDTDDNNDGIIDADTDSDGLIDIDSLEELNAIRFALDGSGQVMTERGTLDRSGCPIVLWEGIQRQRCTGYELVSDLDFDTNDDGQMNELDAYWNDGEGWEPIGPKYDYAFTADFNGNGHEIRNLYIHRRGSTGFFGHIIGTYYKPAKITQVAFTGTMTSVTGSSSGGVLASSIRYAEVSRIFVTGFTSSPWTSGGLAAVVIRSTLSDIFSSATVSSGETSYSRGGLVGILRNSTLSNSMSTGYVGGESDNGILGRNTESVNEHLYWSTNTSNHSNSAGTNDSYFGALLSELQCPTAANNSTCTGNGRLYENWDSDVWDFGSDRQLPGLIMNGVVYRDSDGDGTLDVNYSPTIELLLTQDGREENTIVEGMGDVTIEVIITDENGWDYHSVDWSSNDINLADSYELGNNITFSSDGLVAGDYTISATVTDNGIPQLSDTAEMTIRVLSNVDPAPAASSGGGGSGGGAIFWLLALLSAPLLIGRVRA